MTVFEQEHELEREAEDKGCLSANGVGRELMCVDVGAIDIGNLQQAGTRKRRLCSTDAR